MSHNVSQNQLQNINYSINILYFAVDVQWHEPQMMANCWVQSMLSGRYGFSPNCNEDGTFGPKQCFLQRYGLSIISSRERSIRKY